jgi:hypothetical protein
MGENKKIYISNINSKALRIIPRENNLIFFEEIKISISVFPKFRLIKSVDFSHMFGPVITRDAVKNAESDEYQ